MLGYPKGHDPKGWGCVEENGYDDDVATFLNAELNKLDRDHDGNCPTNFRVAEVGIAAEEARYAKAEASGCCGMEERRLYHRGSRRRFKIGCNYGH